MKLHNPSSGQGKLSDLIDDPFLLGFDFDEVDLAVAFHPPARTRRRKRPKLPKVAKQDVRRHFPKMLLSAMNSNCIHSIFMFMKTFMKFNCTVHLEYAHPTDEALSLVSQGPHLSSFYILGLGVMFPDMIFAANSCQLFTSNTLRGTKLDIQGSFLGTSIYDFPVQEALSQMYKMYMGRPHEGSTFNFGCANDECENGSQGYSSTSDNESPRGSGKSWETEEGSSEADADQDCQIVVKLRKMFDQVPLLETPRALSYTIAICVIMDHTNKMEQVNVTVLEAC